MRVVIKMKYFILVLMFGFNQVVLAGDAEERMYLMQAMNQIQAVKPLLIAAAKEQPKTNRVKFHYTSFRGSDGKTHNGVMEDVAEIEKGIREKLHKISSEPHTFSPIKGDYMNDKNRERNR